MVVFCGKFNLLFKLICVRVFFFFLIIGVFCCCFFVCGDYGLIGFEFIRGNIFVLVWMKVLFCFIVLGLELGWDVLIRDGFVSFFIGWFSVFIFFGIFKDLFKVVLNWRVCCCWWYSFECNFWEVFFNFLR